MSEFFKQLVNQLNQIWVHLNNVQRIILIATVAITGIGLSMIIAWNSLSTNDDGYATLFINLDAESAAQVTASLKETGTPYKLDNNGRTISVPKSSLYEVRMEMARKGLPKQGGQGYELFDELQLGMTDFVQNLNYQRALEGEITRSIQTLTEVAHARVHITIPKPTLFKEKKEEATASVVLKLQPGAYLKEPQVRGITHLVASSVEGLYARQVTVLDISGNMLTKGFADNAMAEKVDHNMSLQRSVEGHLEKKVEDLFNGMLGPNRARVKVSAELDFESIEKTVESYTPSSKVVRSQQRNDGSVKDNPVMGSEQKEASITNYEIDKTAARIINTPGSRKRITVSVVVDGTYKPGKDGGEPVFAERTQQELQKFESLIKNAVGFKPGGEDQVYVTSMEFDRGFFLKEEAEMNSMEQKEMLQYWGKVAVVVLVVVFGFLFLRGVARNIATAMNPPLPRYAGVALESEEVKVPDNVRKHNEIMDRIEQVTRENPDNVASLIRGWLHEMDEEK